MLEKAILESTIFYNFSRLYHQYFTSVSTVDLNNNNDSNNSNNSAIKIKKSSQISKDIMATTLKFKAIFYSIFQAPNPMLIQKSMRHVDAFEHENEYRLKREKNNESVRKSRAKNRVKLQECSSNVKQLKIENVQLNQKLENLQSELYTLKGLFQHCFSFNLNDLAIKPTDIPTSTLYKLIMQNKSIVTSKTAQNTNEQPAEIANKNLTMNNVDSFYINQIKNALSNIVKPEVK